MDLPEPDRPSLPGPSLAQRAAAAGGALVPRLRARPALPMLSLRIDRPVRIAAAAVVLLVATAALLAGLTVRERRLAAALAPRAAPVLAAEATAARLAAQRRLTAPLIERATASEFIERLARALPAGATLAAVGQDAGGRLTVEVLLDDPDRLGDAMAADPGLAGLRTIGERREQDGRTRVVLEGAA